MKFLMVTLMAAGSAATSSRVDEGVTNAPAWELVPQSFARVRGRMLGSLVCVGMTEKEVGRILGERMMTACGLNACGIHGRTPYPDYGVIISYWMDKKDTFRVTGVSFCAPSPNRRN